MSTPLDRVRTRVRSQDGFTMILVLGVMLVTSLLLVAAFAAANGDINLSHQDRTQKQAYYAALAGVQNYEYQLQSNPTYWATCPEPESSVPNEASEHYRIVPLVASTAPKGTTKCETSNPFGSMIETKSALGNTFRIESTGTAGTDTRKIVATFQVSGFLSYVYYTNFETEDPGLYSAPKGCEGKYYKEWSKEGLECSAIQFTTGDAVNGPMHTNDAANVGGAATFGREGHVPPDEVEINGGTYPSAGCEGSATYYTATKCYTTKGPVLVPPEGDTSLGSYVEPKNQFTGATHLVLNGSAGTIAVSYFKIEKGEAVEKKETITWPENGLIYVQALPKFCTYKYQSENSDNEEERENEKGCGNVYVNGTYSKSLTIAGENDLIINNSIYPTSVEGTLGAEPTGTATLGLIASHYVRVYHPCSGGTNEAGSLTNPWIYAAILSTSHSFVVDNHGCGEALEKLHVYGAIAQNYRGIVGSGGGRGGGTGYIKDYKYDGRLATEEPPYFLSPLKAGWKVARETAPRGG